MPADPVLQVDADHRDAERAYFAAGWRPCGEGDWAFALRSPDGSTVARISPFDPVGPYTAELYRRAASTHHVPVLHSHRRLAGGGDLLVMEWLQPADVADAVTFLDAINEGATELSALADTVRGIHSRALEELPWCGPLDSNPANVMRGADGRLVLTDPYYADGPGLYSTAQTDPDAVVDRIPEDQRRFMTEIPLAYSGPWPEEDRAEMRRALAAADERRAARG